MIADMPRRMPWLAPVALAAILLLVWEATVRALQVPEYLVPAPSRILLALVDDAPMLVDALGTTLAITLAALLLAVVLGVIAACVFVQSRVLEASLFPYAVLLQVTPIVAIAPLIIIWVDDTLVALVVCATIVAIFPVISNTVIGLRSVDPGLLDLFRLQRASRWAVLWRLRVPSSLPAFFAGLRIAAGLALIGAVVAEFVAGTGGSRSGLAYQLLQAGYQLNIPRVFAALALITLVGVALFVTTSWLARRALRHWHESELGR
jgi:NitT/TauT family transport system permease protein